MISGAFGKLPFEFGYVCDVEEREHRNRISAHKSYGVHEAWVGRDYHRYLPGVYWLTFIGMELLPKYAVILPLLHDISVQIDNVGGGCCVRLYASPSEWQERADQIDAWCLETPLCFSKRQAEQDLRAATTYLEASAAVRAWC